jgi:D-arginine dehydrogenase
MTTDCDFLVIGAGVSGAAAAFELASRGRVILLEMEDLPGHHSTGRSAALYTPNYGPAVVRSICQAANDFFRDPPSGFAEHPLLSPRGALSVTVDDPEGIADALLNDAGTEHPVEEISMERASALCPTLRPGVFRRALYEPGVMDMDAAAIHQGFLRGIKARGGKLVVSAEVESLERKAGIWSVATRAGAFRAPIVVNAAGAWADRIGQHAGARRIGLQPKLRTAILIEAPAEFCAPGVPVVDVLDTWAYFKPEAGRMMCSPGDETVVDPMDAYPDDLVVAELVDYLERHTRLKIDRILKSWAGLRSFVGDHCPVVGFDPDADGFFWLCGQGGYGIMMSPVLGRAAAELITRQRLPADLAGRGVNTAMLGPERLSGAA